MHQAAVSEEASQAAEAALGVPVDLPDSGAALRVVVQEVAADSGVVLDSEVDSVPEVAEAAAAAVSEVVPQPV